MDKYKIFIDDGKEKQIGTSKELSLAIEKIKKYMILKGYPRDEYNLRVYDGYVILDFGSKSTVFKIKSDTDLSQDLSQYKVEYSKVYHEISRNLII